MFSWRLWRWWEILVPRIKRTFFQKTTTYKRRYINMKAKSCSITLTRFSYFRKRFPVSHKSIIMSEGLYTIISKPKKLPVHRLWNTPQWYQLLSCFFCTYVKSYALFSILCYNKLDYLQLFFFIISRYATARNNGTKTHHQIIIRKKQQNAPQTRHARG